MRNFLVAGLLLLALPALAAADLALPEPVRASAAVIVGERDGYWEKTLVVDFPQPRRTLSTYDGFVEARAAVNHAAHPRLWIAVGDRFAGRDGRGGKTYIEHMRDATARRLQFARDELSIVATAADMDNLAVVSKDFAPLTVTVLVTAGVKSNAIRTGVDGSGYIEGEEPAGTINVILLTNARLSDGAMARAIVTVTEAKTAALQDLHVPSTYTPAVEATGTGTDSVIVVSGSDGPRATYTGGHSKLGELIGKATYEAVLAALEKQNGLRKAAAR